MNKYSSSGKKPEPVRLGSFLDNILAGMGLKHQIGGWRAVNNWNEIVGETLAEHSKAIRYSNGVLLVAVRDAVWRQEMSSDSDRILQEIHKLPGGRAVKKIQFVS